MKLKREQPRLPKATEVIGMPEQADQDPAFFFGRDFTEEDLSDLYQDIGELIQNEDSIAAGELLSPLLVIDPEGRSQVSIHDDETYPILESIEDNVMMGKLDSVPGNIINSYRLFPEKSDETDVVRNDAWVQLLDLAKKQRTNPRKLYLLTAAKLTLLYPERQTEIPATEEDLDNAAKQAEYFLKNKDWQEYASLCAAMAIADQNYFRGRITIPATAWVGMKKELAEAKETILHDAGAILKYASLLESLAVISAEQVELTGRGMMKITPKKPPVGLATSQPLPERPAV
ncbi:MAG: hypothetical protein ABIG66_02720 [Candidatus Kerfeldbacteria bacterium]